MTQLITTEILIPLYNNQGRSFGPITARSDFYDDMANCYGGLTMITDVRGVWFNPKTEEVEREIHALLFVDIPEDKVEELKQKVGCLAAMLDQESIRLVVDGKPSYIPRKSTSAWAVKAYISEEDRETYE